jgi:para-aminobenzoate synthetase / 4-amino-4-deoxychorismate lyase
MPARLILPHALAGGLRRPDPAAGLIETLAVDDHQPVALDLHLPRLAASAAEVLDVALPEGLRDDLLGAAAAAPPGRHRLRIDVTAEGTTFALAPAAPPSLEPVALAPVLLPGGLGAHKWRDRALVDALRERHGAVPLFVDDDGDVLEAAASNMFVVEGDDLVTPPADGRLLPGTTRAALLRLAASCDLTAVEAPMPLERLERADAVVLTSALAGALLGRLRRQSTVPGASALVERVRAALCGIAASAPS